MRIAFPRVFIGQPLKIHMDVTSIGRTMLAIKVRWDGAAVRPIQMVRYLAKTSRYGRSPNNILSAKFPMKFQSPKPKAKPNGHWSPKIFYLLVFPMRF